jgi:hypothetical protein
MRAKRAFICERMRRNFNTEFHRVYIEFSALLRLQRESHCIRLTVSKKSESVNLRNLSESAREKALFFSDL